MLWGVHTVLVGEVLQQLRAVVARIVSRAVRRVRFLTDQVVAENFATPLAVRRAGIAISPPPVPHLVVFPRRASFLLAAIAKQFQKNARSVSRTDVPSTQRG